MTQEPRLPSALMTDLERRLSTELEQVRSNHIAQLQTELAQVWRQRDQYLLELQKTRAVVEAARALMATGRKRPLADALAALDAQARTID